MKLYLANANCDWGIVYSNQRVEASNWHTAFRRAGAIAVRMARHRPKQISISLKFVGIKKKGNPQI